MCFRSRPGLHRVPEGRHSDARRSPVGGAFLLHAAAARTGQSGEAFAAFLIKILASLIILKLSRPVKQHISEAACATLT